MKKQVYLIGNAHLDPVWLWQWQEGFAEVKATFRSALDRIRQFDDFIFTSACGAYYMWIEKSDPAMFAEIQQRVKEGRWVITGGWFIQPDCNLPTGESFARHALITQRYFEEKFGKMAVTGYNVDSFGHNGNIPMILRNSRMSQYVFMRPGPSEKKLPQSLFVWESRDGSRVTTYRIPLHYNLREGREEMFEEIASMPENTDQMAFYGVGNHGGGPTVEFLRWMHENLDDRFIYSDPDSFFAAQNPEALPVVRDDLQFHAKGCYSAVSDVKSGNRHAEYALLRAERFSVLSENLAQTAYRAAELERAWKAVLFNQFHDILGGCTIREAVDDAKNLWGEAMTIAADVENFAVQQISWKIDTVGDHEIGDEIPSEQAEEIGTPVVVFNPLDHEINAAVHLRFVYDRVTDGSGRDLPIQCVRDSKTNRFKKYGRLFQASVPAFGYAVFRLRTDPPAKEPVNPFTVSDHSISNGRIRATFDPNTGELSGLFDEKRNKELLSAPTAIRLFNDESFDTWAHGVETLREEPVSVPVRGEVHLVESGPVRATIRAVHRFANSTVTRDYSITAGSDRVEVSAKVDFHETFRILKFEVPVNCEGGKAICKIPFGSIERPTDGTEQVCGDWFALTDGQRGLGIATDSKYSFDANGETLSLTVLRSPIYADHFGQDYRDEFCEFTEQGIQRFRYCLFPFDTCANAERCAAELQNPPAVIRETFHRGPLPETYGGISVSAGNVCVTAIKQHRSGDGLILRCYETDDLDTDVTVRLFETEFSFHIPHSGVKTFLLRNGKITETDFLE